jgi:hypothetical protein
VLNIKTASENQELGRDMLCRISGGKIEILVLKKDQP